MRDSVVESIRDYSLLGWEEAVYEHEVKKLYRPNLSVSQAILLGVHLFSIAKATSNYIGGDTQAIGIGNQGTWVENTDEVRKLEERVRVFSSALNNLTLACPDVALDADEFQAVFDNFHARAIDLREQYLEAALMSSLERFVKEPYQKYPPDALISYIEKRLEDTLFKLPDLQLTAEQLVLYYHLALIIDKYIGSDRTPERRARASQLLSAFERSITHRAQPSAPQKSEGQL